MKQSLLESNKNSSLIQMINMYSGGVNNIISLFSLGIIPFINSSIILDLFASIFPSLEKLQSEEGESGRRRLLFYKKLLAFALSLIQSAFLINYLRSYFYDPSLFNQLFIGLLLTCGSMLIIWLSDILDSIKIANGASLLILVNILTTFFTKKATVSPISSEGFFLLIILIFISISQTARIKINVVSARQLDFLENVEKIQGAQRGVSFFQKNDSGLSIKMNQAGIFPIIIASNIILFLSYLLQRYEFFQYFKPFEQLFYYFLIIGFNYFYTITFWDPEKISEQLRKASVSIVNIAPGYETVSYLEKVVRSSSLLGGTFLCTILFFYDFAKQFFKNSLLDQLNVSSLIILVGVAHEIQKAVRAFYRNSLEENFYL